MLFRSDQEGECWPRCGLRVVAVFVGCCRCVFFFFPGPGRETSDPSVGIPTLCVDTGRPPETQLKQELAPPSPNSVPVRRSPLRFQAGSPQGGPRDGVHASVIGRVPPTRAKISKLQKKRGRYVLKLAPPSAASHDQGPAASPPAPQELPRRRPRSADRHQPAR